MSKIKMETIEITSDDDKEIDTKKCVKKPRIKKSPSKVVKKKTATAKRKVESDDENVLSTDDKKSDIKKSVRKPRMKKSPSKVVKKRTTTAKRKVESDDEEDLSSDCNKIKKTSTNKTSKLELEKKNELKVIGKKTITQLSTTWTEEELLSQLEAIDYNISRNIVRLFSEDNTIPFIARYRKELTGHMSPEKLRDVRKAYEEIIKIKTKACSILSTLESQGKLNSNTERSILSARSLGELEHIYAPFKVSKHTLAERARQLGLESIATNILYGNGIIDPALYVKRDTKGLEKLVDVLQSLQHIIADIISKDRDLLDQIQKLYEYEKLTIESTLAKRSDPELKQSTKSKSTPHSSNYSKNKPLKSVDPEKFKIYFDFRSIVHYIKPYQILAINRGEALKILSVKITVPDRVKQVLYNFCERHWLCRGVYYPMRTKLFKYSFDDAYKRLINPLIMRETRAELNKRAQKASIEVFNNNLKHLLLTQPVKARKILGIDPGFTNGCKMALISERAELLDTAVIYPHRGQTNAARNTICEMLHKHNCTLIALGNGTACRETETFLGALIRENLLPHGTQYCIINERGASIYSCSEEATKEFPTLDPNLRSAVYIARCLQDPLCEMVKIDPKHLGVGMYQHDVPEKLLSSTLNEVVVECVSFVGVDINTASVVLLKKVAGLNGVKAEKILSFRDKFGPFTSRERLRDVPGIGPKSYEQFIGFIRVVSETSGQEADPLDSTWIHPESYSIAEKISERSNVPLRELGTPQFIERMRSFVNDLDRKRLAEDLKVPEERVSMVLDALCRDPKRDYRCDSKSNQPLFKCNVTSLQDLKVGEVLTGMVDNVTQFGAFVDIGVGQDGLIPVSFLKMSPYQVELGNRVEVRVESMELSRKRITLKLLNIL